jgi:translation initiation factor IF-2
MRLGEVKELNLVLKADVQGSIDPIVKSLKDLGDEDLKVRVLRQGTGNISESDIMLAVASSAIIVGFQVEIDAAAQRLAEVEGVSVRKYDVIYRLIDDIDKALKGLLEPTYEDVVIGHAEVRAIFRIPRRGRIAGSYVRDGQVKRNALARVRRNADEIYDGKISSLRRFTEDVREVDTGYECGIGLEGFEDFQEGDVIEVYTKELASQ